MNNIAKNITLLTLVHNRMNALKNLLNGIERGSQCPSEVIIVYMNEDAYNLEHVYSFPIRSIILHTDKGINLGAARNLAMQESSTENNIFLDVDCIPEEHLIANYAKHMDEEDVLFSGQVRYLPAGYDQDNDWEDKLHQLSLPDPIRGDLQQYTYELFWSLNFGCSKTTFKQIGGFDSQYEGYGAEDTDFAFEARKHGVKLKTIPALSYHQHHATYKPPLNHLQTISTNAALFFSKWAVWPMEGWLSSFEQLGYLRRDAGNLQVLRLPTDSEIEAVRTS